MMQSNQPHSKMGLCHDVMSVAVSAIGTWHPQLPSSTAFPSSCSLQVKFLGSCAPLTEQFVVVRMHICCVHVHLLPCKLQQKRWPVPFCQLIHLHHFCSSSQFVDVDLQAALDEMASPALFQRIEAFHCHGEFICMLLCRLQWMKSSVLACISSMSWFGHSPEHCFAG